MLPNTPIHVSRFARYIILCLAVIIIMACGLNPNSLASLQLFSEPIPAATPTPTQFEVKPKLVAAGLGELDSYKGNLVVEFEGLRHGQPTAGRIESLTEVSRQPPALHRYLKTDIITPTAGLVAGVSQLFETDEKLYVKKAAEESWLALDQTHSPSGQLSAAAAGLLELEQLIILPLTVAAPPRSETLNELSVQHYIFTENDLPDSNIIFDKAWGDLWVASHGNFLIQYVISATVKIVNPLPNAHLLDRGRLTLHYSLTGINTDLEISPPPMSTILRDNHLDHLPRLPDARISAVFPSLLEYTSVISPISATLFYRDELTARDWTENNANIFNEKTQLFYAKADQRLSVIITPTDDPTRVKVVLNLNK